MAIKLSNKPNTAPIDGEYIYGNIRDRDGLTPGTPVSTEVYADIHQFFERMFSFTGLTHNNLPDNDYNGFQLYQALVKIIDEAKPEVIFRLTQTGTSVPVLGSPVKNSFGFSTFTPSRTGVGEYVVTIPGASVITNPPLVTLQTGSSVNMNNGEYFRTGMDGSDMWIKSYNAAGSLADGILDDVMIVITAANTAYNQGNY